MQTKIESFPILYRISSIPNFPCWRPVDHYLLGARSLSFYSKVGNSHPTTTFGDFTSPQQSTSYFASPRLRRGGRKHEQFNVVQRGPNAHFVHSFLREPHGRRPSCPHHSSPQYGTVSSHPTMIIPLRHILQVAPTDVLTDFRTFLFHLTHNRG